MPAALASFQDASGDMTAHGRAVAMRHTLTTSAALPSQAYIRTHRQIGYYGLDAPAHFTAYMLFIAMKSGAT